MGVHFSNRRVALVFGSLAIGLAACQGNLGSSGLSIPQAGGAYGQPNGPSGYSNGGGGTNSRERDTEGAIYLTGDRNKLPLPTVDGFSISVDIVPQDAGKASPVASATPAPGGSASAGSPAPGLTASAQPSVSPASSASAKPLAAASPTASAHPKIATKTIAYPDGAPAAPTATPTGEVETMTKRVAIVRGYLFVGTDVTVPGPGAVHVTIPKSEESPAPRGFTIAIFESGKGKKEHLIAFDAGATVTNGVVNSSVSEPALEFKKNRGYDVFLYGDEAAATPPPVPTGYPTAGANPLPMPSGYTTAAPGQPYQPLGPSVTPQPLGAPQTYRP